MVLILGIVLMLGMTIILFLSLDDKKVEAENKCIKLNMELLSFSRANCDTITCYNPITKEVKILK